MRLGADRLPPSAEQLPPRKSLLGKPEIGASHPEVEVTAVGAVLNLPFFVLDGPTMRIPSGRKIGTLKRASVPLAIPNPEPAARRSSWSSTPKVTSTDQARVSLKERAQLLADSLLETQVRRHNGEVREERVSYLSHETLQCVLHPQFEGAIAPKLKTEKQRTKRLPTVQAARESKRLRSEAQQQLFDTQQNKSEVLPSMSEHQRISKVGTSVAEAAATVNGELSEKTKAALKKLRKMFKCSDFSVADFIGSDGLVVHQQLIDDLDFELSLDPLGPQRNALLELSAVLDETVAPGLHRLVRELAAYDERNDLRHKKNKGVNSNDELPFFTQQKKKLSDENRAKIGTMRATYSEIFRAAFRTQRQLSKNSDPKMALNALMAFHEVPYLHSRFSGDHMHVLSQLSPKNVTEMSHEEITFILSLEMEHTTGPSHQEALSPLLQKKVEEVHAAGLYYFNMDFYAVHDPAVFHGTFVTLPDGSLSFDWCPVHTPGLDLQLSNLSFTPSVPTVPSFSAPSLSGFGDAIGGIASLGQSLPLFAQAFSVLGGAAVGGVFSGMGESSSSQNASISSVLKEKQQPTTNIQLSAHGGGSEKASPSISITKEKKQKFIQRPVARKKILRRKKMSITAPIEIVARPKTPSITKPERTSPITITSIAKPKAKARVIANLPIRPPEKIQIFSASQRKQPEKKLQEISLKKIEKVQLVPVTPIIHRKQPKKERKVLLLSTTPQSKSTTARPDARSKEIKATSSYSARKKSFSGNNSQSTQKEQNTTSNTATFSKGLEKAFIAKSTQSATKKNTIKSTVSQFTRSENASKTTAATLNKTATKQTIAKDESKEKATHTVAAMISTKTDSVVAARKDQTHRDQDRQVQKTSSSKEQNPSRQQKDEKVERRSETILVSEQADMIKSIGLSKETSSENHIATATSLLSGVLIESIGRVAQPTTQEAISPTLVTTILDRQFPGSDAKADALGTRLTRKQAEYGQGGGGGGGGSQKKTASKGQSLKQNKSQKKSDSTSDRVITASLRALPTNALVDVSDSFNTAREVKMWALEALNQPSLSKQGNPSSGKQFVLYAQKKTQSHRQTLAA